MNGGQARRDGSDVLIVGGGASGTLLALNLLRSGTLRVTLAERVDRQWARGIAYSAADPVHLLNVRAGGMSAFPDEPAHFARWLEARAAGAADSFVPRTLYGDYLADLLEGAQRAQPDRLHRLGRAITALEPVPGGWRAHAPPCAPMVFAHAVLAPGNFAPLAPPGLDPAALGADLYCGDPWSDTLAQGLAAGDTVLLLGTGLTAIDAALLLAARGFAGTVIALSRRGLMPRAHDPAQPPVELRRDVPAGPLSRLVREVRAAAARQGWRGAVDALRPVTQPLWAAADPAARRRFLRHLRPYWDVHRHRVAPEIARRVAEMEESGRLKVAAGRLLATEAQGRHVAVTWRARGGGEPQRLRVRRIVNCTGPQGDLRRTDDPLLTQMLAEGHIRPDPLDLGIDVTPALQVIGRSGSPVSGLHALGPVTRGTFWETVAVPDIRVQAQTLSVRLAGAEVPAV
ncbi:FAD-dependent oxidoreductase [Erythrobacteraceae bacterium CFH 75059]|uniref:FAD/NAD(P)-binding protein n=1 Tax=Qipengyuania thermophila TaxID=2509361 RepID=UPI0010215EA1|nr:FAD/NAD(P)-binding protein [Qipengyuania thermophila]TCD06664.1 FAD-dependent oxidoreductase [Erythrobacteraceae bacterium CFH 75059]